MCLGKESANLFYFGENSMTVSQKSIREFARHLMTGMVVNLMMAVLLVDAYFSQTATSRVMAGIRILLAFWALTFAFHWVRRIWKNVKHPLCYFLPTSAVFCAFSERRRRLNAEAGTAQVREIVATWPDTSLGIITGIVDPKRQRESLSTLLSQMDTMKDCYLATITDRIQRYLGEILKSVGNNGNYQLFRRVMLRLSSYQPGMYRQTHKRFLFLLSDVFDPPLSAEFGWQFRKDLIGPLKNAIVQADKAHAGRVEDIIAKIMADEDNKHEIANAVAEMLLHLDWDEKREICRIIFDESVKRAFRFPKHFGIDFLIILGRLEHKIFWLDIQSLRNVLEESLNREGEGLINLNTRVYSELCSKVLAPLEDPARDGICNARVFRRLTSDDGAVRIECTPSDGQTCSCQGESLSFRGVYSRNCRRPVGEKLAMNIIPIQEIERPLAVKASITPLHSYESASQGPGRGAFFEEAESSAVKGLYDYVATKQ
jgi:hypothetical protein